MELYGRSFAVRSYDIKLFRTAFRGVGRSYIELTSYGWNQPYRILGIVPNISSMMCPDIMGCLSVSLPTTRFLTVFQRAAIEGKNGSYHQICVKLLRILACYRTTQCRMSLPESFVTDWKGVVVGVCDLCQIAEHSQNTSKRARSRISKYVNRSISQEIDKSSDESMDS